MLPIVCLDPTIPAHVVITFTNLGGGLNRLRAFCNNRSSTNIAYVKDYGDWSNTTFLQFGPKSGASGAWLGQMYMFAMYTRALSISEIATNYRAYIPNSRPVTPSATVAIFEDTIGNIILNSTDFEGSSRVLSIVALPRYFPSKFESHVATVVINFKFT